MSLDKAIASGKEHRKPYRRAKAVSARCRNQGDCACVRARQFHRGQPARHRIKDAVRREIAQELIDLVASRWLDVDVESDLPNTPDWSPFEDDAPLTAVRFRCGGDDAPWGPWQAR